MNQSDDVNLLRGRLPKL